MSIQREEQIWDEACRRYADSKMRNAFVAAANWADSHPQWIPVEERLPDEGQVVLVHTKRGTVSTACYTAKLFNAYNVTHWMPIVPPRKEEE